MTFRKFIFTALLIGLFTVKASAQVSIDFIPTISGATIDGLLNVRVNNIGPKKTIKLEINVSLEDEVQSVPMVHILAGPFDVNPGSNIIPPAVARAAQVKIGSSEPARFLQQNGYFPSGQYTYDYKVILVATHQVLVEQTFTHDLQPAAPLNLVEPYDGDETCELRPLLSWQPHFPAAAGVQYQVVLSEIKNKQNGIEALQYNLPIINQKAIPATLMMYPSLARPLEKGKRYAWQVTAYQGNTVLNRSEVWTFAMKCPDTVPVQRPELSYRDIEDLSKGNYYMAKGWLSFVMVNSYLEQPLQYSIMCLTDPKLRIRNLPKKHLGRGRNQIAIDLSDNRGFKQDYSYLLTVVMPNGQLKSLRFTYKEI